MRPLTLWKNCESVRFTTRSLINVKTSNKNLQASCNSASVNAITPYRVCIAIMSIIVTHLSMSKHAFLIGPSAQKRPTNYSNSFSYIAGLVYRVGQKNRPPTLFCLYYCSIRLDAQITYHVNWNSVVHILKPKLNLYVRSSFEIVGYNRVKVLPTSLYHNGKIQEQYVCLCLCVH